MQLDIDNIKHFLKWIFWRFFIREHKSFQQLFTTDEVCLKELPWSQIEQAKWQKTFISWNDIFERQKIIQQIDWTTIWLLYRQSDATLHYLCSSYLPKISHMLKELNECELVQNHSMERAIVFQTQCCLWWWKKQKQMQD